MNSWRVLIMPEAKKQLAAIKDSRIQQGLRNALERLKEDPDKRGKALSDDLMGFRGLRAVGERYRIVYQVIESKHEVHIVTVGIRREGNRSDICAITTHLLTSGTIRRE